MEVHEERFDRDPGWREVGNRDGGQDFGFSPGTRHAGGAGPGEAGGTLAPADSAVLFGDGAVDASLDDPLYASGLVSLERGRGGAGVLVGWLTQCEEAGAAGFLGVAVDGDGTIDATILDPAGDRHRPGGGPVLATDGSDVRLTVRYEPGPPGVAGRLRVVLGDAVQEIEVPPPVRAVMQRFDRFGIVARPGGAASVELYLDDLVYTRRPS